LSSRASTNAVSVFFKPRARFHQLRVRCTYPCRKQAEAVRLI
jgi:hypothetical protein